MNTVLIFIEHNQGKPLKASLAALRAASEYANLNKSQLVATIFGKEAASVAEALKSYSVNEIVYSTELKLDQYLSEFYAPALLEISNSCNAATIFAAATSTGKDLLPRLAALLDAGMASDVIAINPDGSFKRPMYAGNVIADLEILTSKKIVSVRPSAFLPINQNSEANATLREFKITSLAALATTSKVVSFEGSKADRPSLADAEVVVSGGRALGSADNFSKMLFPLADALKAAVGASRAAVDSGYAPNDWQVGQTGKVVAPQLYIGVGVSGAVQHLAGMKDSKVIVAINKDPEAPIFEVADYGLVADLFEAVPKLTEAIKRA
jgi:electron transfer flavoprotein alpha subunit